MLDASELVVDSFAGEDGTPKQEAVRLDYDNGRTVIEIAEDLGITT